MTLLAVATVAPATDAQAQRHPNNGGMMQRAAPLQHAAPMLHSAPMQHMAPPIVMPRMMPRLYPNANGVGHVMPTFTQPSNSNAHVAYPHLQPVNPATPLNNPSALRPNLPLNHPTSLRPNLPLNNPGALKPNLPVNGPTASKPDLPLNNANTPTPNHSNDPIVRFVQRRNGIAPQGPATLKPGPGKADFNPAPLAHSPAAQQVKPGFPTVNLHGKIWPISKDSRFLWIAGHRKHFIPVSLLGVVLIGGSYWYPDGYVSMEGPACTGYTPDGCQLQWRSVGFDDGGDAPQCVQYCPQVSSPLDQTAALAQEQAATLPPPPALSANGACQTTIYSEPNFSGNSAPTGDSQPNLSETGWLNEISSIVVGAGTWDFFTDENYGGESVRLPPGTYPTLSAEWTKRIGSFMCVEPGSPA